MTTLQNLGVRIIITILVLTGLFYLPAPAFSQQVPAGQNLIRNGDFEQGFQPDYHVGYDWGAFSNGNATMGWSADSWAPVVMAGQNAQAIEINGARERDRYAGIYQTVAVVPGQQYKLTIHGLIRSSEGSIAASNYGYRLQYAIDHNGGTAWELLNNEAWQELPWDEQPLAKPEETAYRIDTYSTTITAQSNQLTLFVRGWKKWVDDGSAIFNLDEISLVGSVPTAQAASLAEPVSSPAEETVTQASPAQPEESSQNLADVADSPTSAPALAIEAESDEIVIDTGAAAPAPSQEQLPVSGQGADEGLNYGLIGGGLLLILLIGSAILSVTRRRPSHTT